MSTFRLSRVLVLAPMALLWGCNPQVVGGDGSASQADKPGAPADDGNPPPKDPPQGGCDPGDPGKPEDPNGGAPGACTDVVLGDGATCISNADIKTQAVAACDAQQMGLADLWAAFDCPDGSTSAKVHCCAPSGGGGGQQNCTGLAVGDGVTCTADADIKTQAMDACAAQNMSLVNLYEAFDCPGGESTIAKVVCCAAGGGDPGQPKDPGDPPNCTWLAVGDGVTCTADADIKSQAMDACTAQNMALANLGEAFDCPGGESTIAKVECCAPASP